MTVTIPYEIGYEDGQLAAAESGAAAAPDGGWDGWAINLIGPAAMAALLGSPPISPLADWSAAMLAKLRDYARGAQAGADAAIAARQPIR